MKKMLTLLVLAVFLLSAAGCGSAQEADVPAQHATANARSAPPALKTKVLFINTSRDPNGNTYKMGEAFLAGVPHDTLFLNDYKIYQLGQHYDDDRLTDVLAATEQADTIVIGTPVYWHTMSGTLKTFIDRLYELDKARQGALRKEIVLPHAGRRAVRRDEGAAAVHHVARRGAVRHGIYGGGDCPRRSDCAASHTAK